jgi:hypothetical protein
MRGGEGSEREPDFCYLFIIFSLAKPSSEGCLIELRLVPLKTMNLKKLDRIKRIKLYSIKELGIRIFIQILRLSFPSF